jgi:magnesium transporter
MRPGAGLTVSAPSASLLRFLRLQSEQVCFFTPSSQTLQPRASNPSARRRQAFLTNARCLTTTPRHEANVQSSLLNLDFLRPAAKIVPPSLSTHGSAQKPGKLSSPSLIPTCRHGSTDTRPLLGRLWKQREQKQKAPLTPTGLPPLPSFLDELGGSNFARNKTGKAGNELKLRCTEFDASGNVTLMDGEFKKSELIAKVRILCTIHTISS